MSTPADFSYAYQVTAEQLLQGTGRLRRGHVLGKLIDTRSIYFLQDGELSLLLFQEAAECFIAGQFIAAITLGYSFAERAIAGRLHHTGQPEHASASGEQLLKLAATQGWLNQAELDVLNEVRCIRNSLVHFRDPLHKSRPEVQALLNARTTPELLEQKAHAVMHAVAHVLNYTAI